MQVQPATETVYLTADLAEINRKADGSLIGYRLMIKDETNDFGPSITCWKTIGGEGERIENKVFERLEGMKKKLKQGARVHGLVMNQFYSKAQKSVQITLASIGDVTEKAHQ